MAIEVLALPKCDVCGEVWLPQKGPARDNPRKYHAEQLKKGLAGLRCGKCKSPGWDKSFTGDRRRKNPFRTEEQEPEPKEPEPPKSKLNMTRCGHGLLLCPQCPAGGAT